MKKNAMLKIAAVLLVAVLLTTCAISSTFAKYVTDVDSYESGEARVAGWNVEGKIDVVGDLFDETYTYVSPNKGEVKADSDVIAPGTKGDVKLTFTANTIAGKKTEVSGVIELTPTITATGYFKNDYANDFLKRIQFKVNGTQVQLADGQTIETYIANAFKLTDTESSFAAGTDVNVSKVVTISWDWSFDDPTFTTFDGLDCDEFDTKLGNANDATISIVIAASIYQTESGANANS